MKILVADDDRDLVDLLRYAFQRDGYKVVTAFNGESAIHVFQVESPDLVVLDMVMPKREGMSVLQEIRRHSTVPVIVLTSVGDEDHVVNVLRQGADDYVIKPFRPRELRARVEACLRRQHVGDGSRKRLTTCVTCGDITLDPQRREVNVAGRAVHFTPKELSLLQYLMLNHDIVVSTSDLLANVWGYDADQPEHIVKVMIARLRRKIEPDPTQPRHIVNVRGEGYMFSTKE